MTETQLDPVMRLMLGCLLFRLGGEQIFTADEINEIKTVVAGVQVFAIEENKILIKTRGPDAVDKAHAEGHTI